MQLDNKQCRWILENLPGGLVILQPVPGEGGKPVDFIILEANRAFLGMVRRDKGETAAQKFSAVIPGDSISLEEWLHLYARLPETGTNICLEEKFISWGRSYKIFAFREETGCMAVVFRDITVQEQREAELQESKGHYQLLAEYSADIITLFEKGRLVYASPSYERILGYSPREHLGFGISEIRDLIHPGDRQRLRGEVKQNMEKKLSVQGYQYRFRHREGHYLWLEDLLYRDWGHSPDIKRVVIRTQDVTQRKEAEKKLRQSEEFVRAVIDNLPIGVAVNSVSPEVKFKYMNDNFARFYRVTRQQLAYPNDFWEVVYRDPAFREQIKERVTGDCATGDPGKMFWRDVPVSRPGEETFYITARNIPIPDKSLVISTVWDVTQRKKDEQKLVDYALELEELNQQLDEEINKARQVHRRTLPQVLPQVEGFSFAYHYIPARKMGGDFFDVIYKDGRLVVYLSDVVGHGLDGAMMSIFIKNTINSYVSLMPVEFVTPAGIAKHLAWQFYRESYPGDYFICIFLAVIDINSYDMYYTSAGFHDYPLVVLGDGERAELVNGGLPITQAIPRDLLDFPEGKISLTPGSTLLFNTDGISEQMVQGEIYKPRLKETFYRYSHLPPEVIVHFINQDFKAFNKGFLEGDDDITLLILQVEKDHRKRRRYELKSRFGEIDNLIERVCGDFSGVAGLEKLITCLQELAANAIEHGNRLHPGKKVQVEVNQYLEYILVAVEDQGGGFDWRDKKHGATLDLPGKSDRGRGIPLVRMCSRYLLYNQKGTRAIAYFDNEKDF